MEIKEKIAILKNQETKKLIDQIPKYEDGLEAALSEDANFKDQNRGYLASGNNDCSEVKRILAELAIQIPDTSDSGKKKTESDKKSWLERQRTENQDLVAAINRQQSVAFLIDNNQIKIEMAKKRLESARAILALRTAQLNFLASS